MTRSRARTSALAAVLAAAALALASIAGGGGRRLMAQEAKKPAAPAAAKPKAPTPADDKVILPFLTDETFVVGRADVHRVDLDALEKWVRKTSEAMVNEMGLGPDDLKEMRAETEESSKETREWIEAFVAAGGRQVYVLVERESLVGGVGAEIEIDMEVEVEGGGNAGAAAAEAEPKADAGADPKAGAEEEADDDDDGAADGPMLVLPLGEGADPAKLGEMLTALSGGPGDHVATEFGKTLVFATPAQTDAMKRRLEAPANPADKPAGKPAAPPERPELAQAFAAAGDAPFRVAFVPAGDAGRAFLKDAFTEITQEVGGEGDLALVTEGLRWSCVALTQEPEAMTATMTLRAADAERAKGLAGLLTRAVAYVKGEVEPGEGEGGGDGPGADLVKQLDAIKPEVKGETVTMRFDPLLLQMAAFASMSVEGEIDGDPEPPKPDDGGL